MTRSSDSPWEALAAVRLDDPPQALSAFTLYAAVNYLYGDRENRLRLLLCCAALAGALRARPLVTDTVRGDEIPVHGADDEQ